MHDSSKFVVSALRDWYATAYPTLRAAVSEMRMWILVLWMCVSTGVWGAEESRPNVLFIVTDDQAEWSMGCSGNREARTPNMDRLAREGARLTNCFTPTPVCSPSRVAILASRYGSEMGIFDWINPQSEPTLGLDPGTAAWPRLLAEKGYRTGLIGKWHLGTEDRFHPSKFGYQYFMGFRAGGTTPRDPELEVDGQVKKVEGYVVDLLTDDAVRFVERNAEEAFALSVHYREPHRPYTPLPDSERTFSEGVEPTLPNPEYPDLDVEQVKKLTKEYLGSVAAIDRNVGRMLDALDRLKLTEKTLVIFTSDHGYNIGHHGIWHKGNASWLLKKNPPGTENIPEGKRPNVFDTSLRVPALVRWPGKIPAGRVVARTVTHLDWFPTVLAACGAKEPAEVVLRGKSVLPLLSGEGTFDRNDDLYVEYSVHHTMRADMRMYRTPEWKLKVDLLNQGRDELYDLAADPGETVNLIELGTPSAKRAYETLKEKIVERIRDVRDPLAEKFEGR